MAVARRQLSMQQDFPLSPSPSPGRSGACSGSSSPVLGYKDLAAKLSERILSKDPFFSLEFFPPRTPNAAVNLIDKIERMAAGGSLFCDVTWHPGTLAGGSPPAGARRRTGYVGRTDPALQNTVETTPGSISMAAAMLNQCGIETMLHLTCCNQTRAQIREHLMRAKECGIKNVMALRGDPPAGQQWQTVEDGFAYAIDLVKYIRSTFGDFFVIVVAAYPSCHPESQSRAQDLMHLKAKVDAGADFIITQLFFQAETFLKFVRDCRAIGITCPIIPGIMPIQNYRSLVRMAELSKLEIPQTILDTLEPIKDNEECVRQYGIQLAIDMCTELLNSQVVPGLHFYTLNREKACTIILDRLGLGSSNVPRTLPWKKTANYSRAAEEIRPIFWALRPKSYVTRTSDWDEFPNGRWGNSSAPCFADIIDHHLFFLKGSQSHAEQLAMWGSQPITEQEIWDVFYCHISGTKNAQGHTVNQLPWHDGQLDSETKRMIPQLSELNRQGYLTINSQPAVNGAPSEDPEIGWGYKGGYVYQKAYLEFFVSPQRAAILLDVLKEKYSHRVNYHIINFKGDSFTNSDSLQPIAVTWGVFPGKEIIQPTVVDPISFKIWKDEAFGIWMEHWGQLYPEGSPSRQLIGRIQQEYFLVNLVDNDFPKENVLWEAVQEVTRRADLGVEAVPLASASSSPSSPSSSSSPPSPSRSPPSPSSSPLSFPAPRTAAESSSSTPRGLPADCSMTCEVLGDTLTGEKATAMSSVLTTDTEPTEQSLSCGDQGEDSSEVGNPTLAVLADCGHMGIKTGGTAGGQSSLGASAADRPSGSHSKRERRRTGEGNPAKCVKVEQRPSDEYRELTHMDPTSDSP